MCILFVIFSCILVLALGEIQSAYRKLGEMRLLIEPVKVHTLFGDRNSQKVGRRYDGFPQIDMTKGYEKKDLKSLRVSKIEWVINSGIAGLRFKLTDGQISENYIRTSDSYYDVDWQTAQ